MAEAVSFFTAVEISTPEPELKPLTLFFFFLFFLRHKETSFYDSCFIFSKTNFKPAHYIEGILKVFLNLYLMF